MIVKTEKQFGWEANPVLHLPRNFKTLHMKKLLIIFCLTLFAFEASYAQSSEPQDHVIYMDIPKKLKIRDKIFLENRSPYTVIQAVVVMKENGQYQSLGTASYLGPNSTAEMASYDHRALKNLRGQRIGIKIKGIKKILSDQTALGMSGNVGLTGIGFGFQKNTLRTEDVNNINPEDITYDFSATFYEDSHDLYIRISDGTSQNVLDF